MDLSRLLPYLQTGPRYRELIAALQSAPSPDAAAAPQTLALGLLRAARPPLLAALARALPGPIVVLTARAERALALRDEISAWDPGVLPLIFSEPTPVFYERTPWGPRTVRERIAALARMTLPCAASENAGPFLVIASARALITPTLPVREFLSGTAVLSAGGDASPERLARAWVDLGYRPESLVVEPGQLKITGTCFRLVQNYRWWNPAS